MVKQSRAKCLGRELNRKQITFNQRHAALDPHRISEIDFSPCIPIQQHLFWPTLNKSGSLAMASGFCS